MDYYALNAKQRMTQNSSFLRSLVKSAEWPGSHAGLSGELTAYALAFCGFTRERVHLKSFKCC
jgi:hypothetical protein